MFYERVYLNSFHLHGINSVQLHFPFAGFKIKFPYLEYDNIHILRNTQNSQLITDRSDCHKWEYE